MIRQVEELRRAGKLDEAVAAAERALELEPGPGRESEPREAEALARLAELHELRGDWVEAVGRRKEALAVRVGVDGKEHWRTADARLALAFAEKVAGLGQADRAKVGGALRREQEAARLEEQGKFAEAERWRWKRWRPTGHWSVRSRRRWRGPGIESAGAGRHGTTQAEPRRPTSGPWLSAARCCPAPTRTSGRA